MYRTLIALVLCAGAGIWTSCSDTRSKFVAEGQVTKAEGQMLYLEEVGTGDIFALDSVLLDTEGHFRFEHPGAHYPMFYRLRLGRHSIPFAADSSTFIQVRSTGASFGLGYELQQADLYNKQIQEISLFRHETDRRIDSVLARYTRGEVGLEEAQQAVEALAGRLKHEFTKRYIYVDPKSPAAYYALFQRKGQAAYFSTEEGEDARAFAAVATAYDTYYKDAPYTPFLKEMALKAIALERAHRQRLAAQADTTIGQSLRVIDYPEINLKDKAGKEQRLSDIASQGPVLLSFTSYSAPWSPMLVGSLRNVQEKRPEVQIYEVSIDTDRYIWENAVRTLPWICVNDPEESYLGYYNVRQIPTLFYISRGELKRISKPEDIL